jgi:hypothetical protein
MVKTIDVLTHPTPARRDAPFRGQGRREFERRGVCGRMLKMAIQRGRRREKTGGVAFLPARPELAEQLFPGGLR